MRLISEVKNLEKSKGDLNLSDLSTRKNRIKSIIVTDDKALKEFRAKISKFAPRQSVPNKILNSQIRNIKLDLNKSTSRSNSFSDRSDSDDNKSQNKLMDNSSGGGKGRMIKTYGYDLTKTYNTKILKPYELDD